jgi:putative hemolysin
MEIIIIVVLTLLNGLFAMSEIAVVSSRKARLENAAKRGSQAAKRALSLVNEPNEFLSTVQIGITLIGILLGIFSGENLTDDVQGYIERVPILLPYSRPIAVGLVLLFITYLSLVLGELVPKRVGLTMPEAIAKTVALPMIVLSKITAPFVWLLSISSDVLLKILNIKPSADSRVTEEEIKAIVQEGAEGGEIEEIEQNLVERVFYLGDRRVSSLMTYRGDLVWLDVDDSPERLRDKIQGELHAVYPVCQGTLDNTLGVVYLKDLFSSSLGDGQINLQRSLRPVQYIPESNSAYQALERFKQTKIHYGLVTDEYGSVQGLVTLNDLVDALVGDLAEVTPETPGILTREDGSWLVDAQYPFFDFLTYFDLNDVVNDDDDFNTLAGLLLDRFGYIPTPGERIRWMNFELEVVDTDGARIDKVLVTRL